MLSLDIHLKIDAVTSQWDRRISTRLLDIHLRIDAVTSCMSEYDEYQRYITKIK